MIKIPIQSVSDVITNSSTEAYLVTTSTNYVEELIDTLLKLGGNTYTCNDLFKVEDSEDCYQITALNDSDSEIADKIEDLINNLFFADGYYNG